MFYLATNEAVPQSSSSGHKSLLNREKQKLISLNEARNQSDNNSTESQQDYEYIKFPDLNKKNTHNSSHSPSDDSPSSTKNVSRIELSHVNRKKSMTSSLAIFILSKHIIITSAFIYLKFMRKQRFNRFRYSMFTYFELTLTDLRNMA